MNEFLKSFSSLSLALALFPLKQIENILTPKDRNDQHGPATKAMDSITNAVVDQFGGTLEATFSALDNVQRGTIALCVNTIWPWRGYSRVGRHRGYASGSGPVAGGKPASFAERTSPPSETPVRVRQMRPATDHGHQAAYARKR